MLPLGHMGVTVAVVRVLGSNFQSFWIDYRLLLVASLLPDLIDKPIGYLFRAYPIISGRHYGHSVLFLIILFMIAFVQWYYWNHLMMLTIGIGALSHDILDLVSHHEDWAERTLFSTNMLIAFEIIGGCLLTYFFMDLLIHKKVDNFFKSGEL